MQHSLIPIGQMARLNDISVPTLRLYDELGLLKPRFVDNESGYRYYDIQQNARLDMIAYMKELGMSLKEISDILESENIALIEELLINKNEQIHKQIRTLKIRHDAVLRAIEFLERYRKSPNTGTVALEYIDRRYIHGIKCNENFYDRDISSYEKVLVELRRELQDREIPQIHSYNVGTSIDKKNIEEARFIADKVFIFFDRYYQDLGVEVEIIESGMYACIYTEEYDEELKCANLLLEYCKEHGYTIAGDYICEVLTEFNVFDDSQRSMFLRLQVPVSFPKKKI